MKKILIFTLALAFSLCSWAQNSETKMDDYERIAIAVNMSGLDLSLNEAAALENKLKQLVSADGIANDAHKALFFISPSISINSSTTTSTQPSYKVFVLDISFSIKDSLKNNVYSTVSRTYKGIGKSKEEAYINAFSRINIRKPYFKAFLRKAKENIISFYNTDIEFVLAKAKAYIENDEIQKAKDLLLSVPEVCRESYDKAMDLHKTIN